jgi:hypothetical protein
MLWSAGPEIVPVAGGIGAPIIHIPSIPPRYVVQASFIQSDREIFFFSQDLSIFSVSESSIVIEYRTMSNRLVVHDMRVIIGACTVTHIPIWNFALELVHHCKANAPQMRTNRNESEKNRLYLCLIISTVPGPRYTAKICFFLFYLTGMCM